MVENTGYCLTVVDQRSEVKVERKPWRLGSHWREAHNGAVCVCREEVGRGDGVIKWCTW